MTDVQPDAEAVAPEHEPTVTILASELAELRAQSEFLQALELNGVRNWVGYEDAEEIARNGC